MKKKIITATIVIALCSAVISGIYLMKNHTEKSNPPKREKPPIYSIKVIDVEKVVRAPEQYRDFVGVKGRVIKIDESKSIFLLGCADVCIFMPVKYRNQMPKVQSEIIVYGEIKKEKDGRYVFQGKEVKTE